MILGSSSGEDDLVMGDFNGIPSPQLSPVQTDNVKTKTDNIMTGLSLSIRNLSECYCMFVCFTPYIFDYSLKVSPILTTPAQQITN